MWRYLLLFVSVVAFGACFWGMYRSSQHFGGRENLLDIVCTPSTCIEIIDRLEPAQQLAHARTTATYDGLLPLLYGAVLAIALNLGGASSSFYVLLGLAVLSDYVENYVQLLALRGEYDLLSLKFVVTPFKFTAIFICGMAVIYSWLSRSRPKNTN